MVGFTKSDSPVSPVISSGPFGYEHVNAAHQRREPDSLLNWMERIIRMPQGSAGGGGGATFRFLTTRDPAVLAIRYDWRNNSVVFVHNLAATPREVKFEVGIEGEEGGCW